jgi:hypothetical protein
LFQVFQDRKDLKIKFYLTDASTSFKKVLEENTKKENFVSKVVKYGL